MVRRILRMIELTLLTTFMLLSLISSSSIAKSIPGPSDMLQVRCADSGCPACPDRCDGRVDGTCSLYCYDEPSIACGPLGCPYDDPLPD